MTRRKIELGASRDNLAITVDIPTLVDTRLLIQAQSGGGKSGAIRRILEQSHGMVQHLILDPEGEFGTLRERFDYIVAGPGGDCAVDPRTAKLLARRLLELGVSAVIDLYELKAHDRIAFVRDFLVALIEAPRTLRHPVLVVIDEAHIFCPEKGQAASAPAVIDLCTRGRKRGLGAVLATQRLSKLHKDAAAELRNKLIGATGLDIDQVRAGDDLGFDKAARQALRNLATREFWAYGPAIAASPVLTRVGDCLTSMPTIGHALRAIPPASAKVRGILANVADLPAEAKAEADRLQTAEATVSDLRRTLAALRRQTEPPVVVAGIRAQLDFAIEERDASRAVAEAWLRDAERIAAAVHDTCARLAGEIVDVAASIGVIASRRASPLEPTPTQPIPGQVHPKRIPAERRAPARPTYAPAVAAGVRYAPSTNGTTASDGVTRPQQKLLDALARLEAFGIAPAPKRTLAALAGVPLNGNTYNNLSRLNVLGLAAVTTSTVALTDAGRQAAAWGEPLASVADLHEAWFGVCSGPQRRILELAIAAYPSEVAKADAAEELAIPLNGNTYNNISKLKTLGALDVTPRAIRAADILFPSGVNA